MKTTESTGKTPETICAFYSRGPHFLRMLKFLRALHPAARITAVVPPSFPAEAALGIANQVIKTQHAQWSLRQQRELRKLVRVLREGHYDLFVTMFDSPKLRVLAALSGAPIRQCYTIDGRYLPLRLALGRQLLSTLTRNLRGRLLYAYLHYQVYFRKVQKA